MKTASTRQIVVLWLAALAVTLILFSRASSVYKSEQTKGYLLGLAGLLAIGVALALTWRWVRAGQPRSPVARRALRIGLLLATALWFILMIFPFL